MKSENKYLIFDKPCYFSLKSIAKLFFYPFFALFFRFVKLLSKTKRPKNKKYKVSICAIFKNESKYLLEWIEYHKIVGIDHFYLFNNNSTDDYLKILEPYISSNLITLIQWPKPQSQIECYNFCISKFKNETEWLGFIDIDEFVVPNKDFDNVYSFLKPFEKQGSVLINWKMFGTSGLINRKKNSLVTESFFVCWPKYDEVGKCFYNTNFDYSPNFKLNKTLHHHFWTKFLGINLPPVNVFGKQTFWGINPIHTNDLPIQINHYFTKSYQEYLEKQSKGDVFYVDNPHDDFYFYKHEMKNSSTDYHIYKYLIKLKIAMKRL